MAGNPIFTIIAEISAEFYIQHTTTTKIIEIFQPVFDRTQNHTRNYTEKSKEKTYTHIHTYKTHYRRL